MNMIPSKISGLMIAGLLSMSACDFQGTMSVSDSLKVVDRRGDTHVLKAGSYNTQLEPSAFGRKLRFEIRGAADQTIRMQFPLPSEFRNENYSGPINLKATDMGQYFDVQGTLQVITNTSGPYHRDMQCVYDTYVVRDCRDVQYRDSNGNIRYRRECTDLVRNIYGTRHEDYQVISTDRTANLKLLDASSKREVGTYRGNQNLGTRENTLWSSGCRRDRFFDGPYHPHGLHGTGVEIGIGIRFDL